MKFIDLSISRVRKISLVELTISDNGLTQIKGPNRQGKTTVLDAMEVLLRGKKAITKDMISHGQTNAVIKGTLKEGDDVYHVERELRDGKPPLLRLKKNGVSVKSSPESFLSSLVSDLTFNPRPFMDKTDDEKQKFMMKVANIDFTEIDAKIKETYDERTLVGREVAAYGDIVLPEKVEQQSVKELLAKRAEILEQHELVDKKQAGYEETKGKLDGLITERDTAAAKIIELQKEIDAQTAIVNELAPRIEKGERVVASKLAGIPEKLPLSEIDDQLANIEEINVKAAAYHSAREKAKSKDAAQVKYDALSGKIEAMRDSKETILKEAKLPVPGLELRTDGLFHNGIHSSNWSESESMRISADLCIATNPELRAVFIDRGEAYDAEGLKELHKWAVENDMQAIISIVSEIEEGDEAGVYYMSEGEVI